MRHSNRRRAIAERYDSLTSFYAADPRRVRSRERDIGLWWRDEVGGPLHRAAWVAETGELYLVRLGPPEAGGGEVEVLARVGDRERLEGALRGWRERCGEGRSLAWLRTRAARLNGVLAGSANDDARTPARRVGSGADHAGAGAGRAGARRAGAGAGAMPSAMSSIVSELSYKSRPRARATPRSPRPFASRLAPGLSPPVR